MTLLRRYKLKKLNIGIEIDEESCKFLNIIERFFLNYKIYEFDVSNVDGTIFCFNDYYHKSRNGYRCIFSFNKKTNHIRINGELYIKFLEESKNFNMFDFQFLQILENYYNIYKIGCFSMLNYQDIGKIESKREKLYAVL